jgi:hypothetical protein
MKTSAKSISRSLVLFIIVLLGVLSFPEIVTAGEGEAAARLQGQRLRQQEKVYLKYQDLLVKARAQQAQIRQWHRDAARSKRLAAKAKEKPQNQRNMVAAELLR